MKKNKKNIDGSPKKKSKKKFILLAILLFVASFCVGFYFNSKKEEPLVADSYTIETDTVESITAVTQKGVLTDIVTSQEDGKNIIEYVYEKDSDFQTAIDEYTTYIQEEKGFVELKDQEEEEEKSEVEDLDEENSESNEDISVLKFAAESQEEGKIFEITIQQGTNNYYITVFREEGELPKTEEEEKQEFTRDDARVYLKNFIDESKELTLPFDNYTNIFDVGRSIINGEECYGVNIYQKGQSECNEFVVKYYISLKEKNIYRYDSETGECVKIN